MNISLGRNLLRSWRLVLVLLAVALLGLLVTQGCATTAQDIGADGQEGTGSIRVNGSELAPAPEIGYPAPDFTLLDLEGNQVTLSEFRGNKTVFVNFWATWCPPCRAEMPEIEAVYQEYKGKDVEVIGVDLLETKDEVSQFVQQYGYSWTFVLDTTGEVATTYNIAAIPTSFFIDREGIIRVVNIGAMTKRAMKTALDLTVFFGN